MGILVVIALTISIFVKQRQLSKDFAARRGDASIKASSSATEVAKAAAAAYELACVKEGEEKEKDKTEVKGLLEVTFRDLSLPPVLSSLRGSLPAGKISAILGPTAW